LLCKGFPPGSYRQLGSRQSSLEPFVCQFVCQPVLERALHDALMRSLLAD